MENRKLRKYVHLYNAPSLIYIRAQIQQYGMKHYFTSIIHHTMVN